MAARPAGKKQGKKQREWEEEGNEEAPADEVNAAKAVTTPPSPPDAEGEEEESAEAALDRELMRQAVLLATSGGGERGSHGPFPRPACGAVLATADGQVRRRRWDSPAAPLVPTSQRRPSILPSPPQILGRGRFDYASHAVEVALADAGLSATPLREWCVAWPADAALRRDVAGSALYVTLEPGDERQG